jgi:hypothetical protein
MTMTDEQCNRIINNMWFCTICLELVMVALVLAIKFWL